MVKPNAIFLALAGMVTFRAVNRGTFRALALPAQ
jgi:hypothetical protein